MDDNFERFDMKKPPIRQKKILRDVIKLVSNIELKNHKTVIERVNMEGLKPPYLLLSNHNAFFDFFVAGNVVYPARANYVVAIDGFTTPTKKGGFKSREGIMRNAGCICKRKFTNDITLVRQLQTIIKNNDVAIVYPEARYSLCGTEAPLPKSLGKLVKLLKVPVVTIICHGHHVNSPFYNVGDRKVKGTEATLTQIVTKEELDTIDIDEINRRIYNQFKYDDYKWFKDKGLKMDNPKRAEGLHKVLYQCPHCKKEYYMSSKGNELFCESCGKKWIVKEDLSLESPTSDTEFTHIPDWYEWERSNVKKEVEEGRYSFTTPVHVSSLPNSKGYIDLGKGAMTHDLNGFKVHVSGKYGDFDMEIPAQSQYSVHIEYEYLGKYGDCVDLNTLTDTWYTYPECERFSVTKMSLATEEIYLYLSRKNGIKPNIIEEDE